jgi:hypothetical protein
MSLVGKFFSHFGKEYHQTGQIVEQIDDEMLLVRFDKCEHIPSGMVVIPASSMVTKMDKEGAPEVEWEFFGTRAELDAWIAWLDAPPEEDDRRKGGEAPKLN